MSDRRLLEGHTYLNKGDLDRAIASFTEAIVLDPECGAHHKRGLAYKIKGDLDRAIADFTEAIRLKPQDFVTYCARGAAYESKDDLDRALADYEAVLAIDPKQADALAGQNRVRAARKGKDNRPAGDKTAAQPRTPSERGEPVTTAPTAEDAPEVIGPSGGDDVVASAPNSFGTEQGEADIRLEELGKKFDVARETIGYTQEHEARSQAGGADRIGSMLHDERERSAEAEAVGLSWRQELLVMTPMLTIVIILAAILLFYVIRN